MGDRQVGTIDATWVNLRSATATSRKHHGRDGHAQGCVLSAEVHDVLPMWWADAIIMGCSGNAEFTGVVVIVIVNQFEFRMLAIDLKEIQRTSALT